MKPGAFIGLAGGLFSLVVGIGSLVWQTAQKFADMEHRIAAVEKAAAPAWQGDFSQSLAESLREEVAALRIDIKKGGKESYGK